MIGVLNNLKYKSGWHVSQGFSITLHIKDLAVLEKIRAQFGVGDVSINGKSCIYRVRSLPELLDVINPHFENFPLITVKRRDYLLFKQAVYFIQKKRTFK